MMPLKPRIVRQDLAWRHAPRGAPQGIRLACEQHGRQADPIAAQLDPIVELADTKASGAAANRGRNANAERLIFSEKFACPVSGFTIPEIEPRLFSFNNPFGACPACGGLGCPAARSA